MRLLFLIAFLGTAFGVAAEPYQRGGYSFEYLPAPKWVQLRKVAKDWPAAEALAYSDAWRTWLLDTQVNMQAKINTTYVDYVFEPRTAMVLDQAAQYSISFSPEFQRLHIHEVSVLRDGKALERFDPEQINLGRREADFENSMYTGQVSAMIVLSDVRVGDKVRLRYSIIGENPILNGHSGHRFTLAWRNALLDRYVRIIADRDPGIQSKISAGEPAPEITERGDAIELSWHRHARAGRRDEGEYPAWYEPYPMLEVAPKQDWATIARWAETLYPPANPLSSELKARLARWKALPNEEARALAALRFVQDDIRYFGVFLGDSSHKPAEPNLVSERRYGDCKDKSRLLTELLRAMDISAAPALVSIQRRRAVLDALPDAGAFDHVIVRASIDGRVAWLDGTRTLQRGDLAHLGFSNFGAALVLDGQSSAPTKVKRSESQVSRHQIKEEISYSGGVPELKLSVRWQGDLAETMRARFSRQGRESMVDNWQQYYQRMYGELEPLRSAEFVDDEQKNQFGIEFNWRLPALFKGGLAQTLEAHAVSAIMTLPDVMDRAMPLAQGFPLELEHQVVLSIGPDQRVSANLGELEVADRDVSYRRSIKQNGQQLVISHYSRTLDEVITAADASAHIASLKRLRDLTSVNVSVRSAAVTSDTRKERLQQMLEGVLKRSAPQASGSQPAGSGQ